MDLWLVGAGGVGREALDVATALGVPVAGFVDDALHGTTVRGLPVQQGSLLPTTARFLVGIASPEARERLSTALEGRGLSPLTLVHPRAEIAPSSSVDAGSLVMFGAYVSSSVTLGRHVQVHYNATVGHDAQLEDFASVYPGARVSGAVTLRHGATVGSGAVVLQGLTVGRLAFVGAGAVVTRDVPDGETWVGCPARPLKRP